MEDSRQKAPGCMGPLFKVSRTGQCTWTESRLVVASRRGRREWGAANGYEVLLGVVKCSQIEEDDSCRTACIKTLNWGWGCSSVAQCLPVMRKTQGSVPSTVKNLWHQTLEWVNCLLCEFHVNKDAIKTEHCLAKCYARAPGLTRGSTS